MLQFERLYGQQYMAAPGRRGFLAPGTRSVPEQHLPRRRRPGGQRHASVIALTVPLQSQFVVVPADTVALQFWLHKFGCAISAVRCLVYKLGCAILAVPLYLTVLGYVLLFLKVLCVLCRAITNL